MAAINADEAIPALTKLGNLDEAVGFRRDRNQSTARPNLERPENPGVKSSVAATSAKFELQPKVGTSSSIVVPDWFWI